MKSDINGCYCFISMIIQTFGGKSIKLRAALGVKPATTTTDDASSHLSVHHQTTNYSVGMINESYGVRVPLHEFWGKKLVGIS